MRKNGMLPTRCGLAECLIIGVVVLVALGGIPSSAKAAGDHLWNIRWNYDDRFHSNEAWLRPWRYNYEDGWGRWVGGYAYPLQWGPTTTIAETTTLGDPVLKLRVPGGRDYQCHFWTYVYVQQPKTIPISTYGREWVPRLFLNYAFDSPVPMTSLALNAGWNRIDFTVYNQNDSWYFECVSFADQVDIMNHEQFDLTPQANFTWAPSHGWSNVTPFTFTDTSAGSPDSWAWDVNNDGTTDYTTRHVSDHTYTARDGQSASYSVTLRASHLGVTDGETKQEIVTVHGKPVAAFTWTTDHLLVRFTNTSAEPGKTELAGYTYVWDMDDDGEFDDEAMENPYRVFPAPGEYRVGCRVTNGAGSDTWWSEPISVTALIGDADYDNDVDLDDFAILRANFGRTGVTGGATEGDFDEDGDVDLNDFVLLKQNYGAAATP
ncbi:MAG: PKD domain-containing protein [Planctomycetota bacterium]